MPELEYATVFLSPLESLRLGYMVSGSMASSFYGSPRLTHDIDLILDLPEDRIADWCSEFVLASYYCPPEETLQIECRRPSRGHFNLIHHQTGFKADIYLAGQDPLQRWGLNNRRKLSLGNLTIWLAPPEYVILSKLDYFRQGHSEKHPADIAGILNSSADLIDRKGFHEWLDRLDLSQTWNELGLPL